MNALANLPPFQQGARSDRELVAACLSGEEDAWGALVDRYSRLIFSIPLRQGLGREEAADIFQAVCLDLIVELPRLRDPQALPAWLIRTTARKAAKWRHRNQRYVADEGAGTEAAASEEPPDALIEHCQRSQALRDGIASLPERCRVMVQMLFFETPARPYREVAEALGVATGSIGFMRGQCLDRLRSVLRKAGL